jgi:hypothetical protein
MDRREKILVLALAIPLLLYCVPYAYATTVSSSYVVSNGVGVSGDGNGYVSATCNPGDYATGGGFYLTDFYLTPTVFVDQPYTTTPPTGWTAAAYNPNSFTVSLNVYVVCQTPITVAGITVPEFGSLYAAIAIAAIAYFGLSLLRARKTPKLTTPTPR